MNRDMLKVKNKYLRSRLRPRGIFKYHPHMTLTTQEARQNPYDELPYSAYPIVWTAPERLALASLLHGGPRLPLDRYRVLELGCANGANLLPMAWYRRHGEFTGMDASARQIGLANDARDQLGLSNLRFVHADFRSAIDQLEGPFDVIMAHGVFSWVTDEARDAMLEMCSALLAPEGLLYLNYNANPGWIVRGMVRDFLMQQTAHVKNLKERAELCRDVSARVISPFKQDEHPYTKLMANEFKLVAQNQPAYLAHEYLSPENNAYWRSEFFAILKRYGFDFIADADFNCISNRITNELAELLTQEKLTGRTAADSADLLCYRQMQSPILTRAPFVEKPCTNDEFSELFIASSLMKVEGGQHGLVTFRQPSGREVETGDESVCKALLELQKTCPRGLRIGSVFEDVAASRENIEYLLHHELIELRCIEPGDFEPPPGPLNELEQSLRNISTSPWHTTTGTREAV